MPAVGEAERLKIFFHADETDWLMATMDAWKEGRKALNSLPDH